MDNKGACHTVDKETFFMKVHMLSYVEDYYEGSGLM